MVKPTEKYNLRAALRDKLCEELLLNPDDKEDNSQDNSQSDEEIVELKRGFFGGRGRR